MGFTHFTHFIQGSSHSPRVILWRHWRRSVVQGLPCRDTLSAYKLRHWKRTGWDNPWQSFFERGGVIAAWKVSKNRRGWYSEWQKAVLTIAIELLLRRTRCKGQTCYFFQSIFELEKSTASPSFTSLCFTKAKKGPKNPVKELEEKLSKVLGRKPRKSDMVWSYQAHLPQIRWYVFVFPHPWDMFDLLRYDCAAVHRHLYRGCVGQQTVGTAMILALTY